MLGDYTTQKKIGVTKKSTIGESLSLKPNQDSMEFYRDFVARILSCRTTPKSRMPNIPVRGATAAGPWAECIVSPRKAVPRRGVWGAEIETLRLWPKEMKKTGENTGKTQGKHGENGDLPLRNGDLSIRHGDFNGETWEFKQQKWEIRVFNQLKSGIHKATLWI